MKIYTKTGDLGETSLLGGTRVKKHHDRIEAYGTVDELNTWMGVLRDLIKDEKLIVVCKNIQDRLFTIGSHLASEKKDIPGLPNITESDVEILEKLIDDYTDAIPPLRTFILPGGCLTASYAHVARAVCRRAERRLVEIAGSIEVDPLLIKYLNRLSDFLFILARKLTFDLNGKEIPWNPK